MCISRCPKILSKQIQVIWHNSLNHGTLLIILSFPSIFLSLFSVKHTHTHWVRALTVSVVDCNGPWQREQSMLSLWLPSPWPPWPRTINACTHRHTRTHTNTCANVHFLSPLLPSLCFVCGRWPLTSWPMTLIKRPWVLAASMNSVRQMCECANVQYVCLLH